MNCPDPVCRLVQCVVSDDIPSYLGDYSLQAGFQFTNLQLSVPSGGGFYIVAPGTIVINLPPNPTVVSYQGCQSMVSEQIPTGSSPADIQQIVSEVMSAIANQLGQCNAPKPTGSPFLVGSFTNSGLTLPCGDGMVMQQIGDLPRGVSFSTGGLSIGPGIFSSSISQEDADAVALDYLDQFFGVSVECGWFNTQQQAICCDMTTQTVAADTIFSLVSQADADAQALAQATAACPTCYWNTEQSFTCSDMSVQTVPAHTFMSIISQADADAQALAAAEAMCPATPCQAIIDAVSWNVQHNGMGTPVPGGITANKGSVLVSYASTAVGQSVDDVLTGTFHNTGSTTCTFTIASSITTTITPPTGSCIVGQNRSAVIEGRNNLAGNLSKQWNDLLGSPSCQVVTVINNAFTTSFTLAAGATFQFGLEVNLFTLGGTGGGVAVSADFEITTP